MRSHSILFTRFLFITFSSVLFVMLSECKDVSENNDKYVADDTCSFTIQNIEIHRISDQLLGFNVVYPHEKDQIWEDGKIAGFLKEIPASLIRYPGGTVASFYHWNALSGNGWADSFDPENQLANKPGSEFMDVDEYIALIKKTGATPLIGINMSSAWRWNRLEEGIQEALALMDYCRNKNLNVKYWYLDNEPYQPDSNGGSKTIEEYAGLVNQFAVRMREFDPDIELIVNWNSAFKNRRSEYQKLLSIAGANIQIIDGHWYWSWSNPTFEKWLSTTPMEVWTGDSYMAEIDYFRQMVKEFGYPEIKLASLEWNVGPVKENQLTPHQCALIQSEMLMQFIMGDLDMATFWPLHWPDKNNLIRSFINTENNSTQPNFEIFKFMGGIQGYDLLKTVAPEQLSHTMYFGGTSENRDTLKICFLNKNPFTVQVNVSSVLFSDMTLQEIKAFVLTESGKNSEVNLLSPTYRGNSLLQFISPEISLTMITFVKK